MVNNTNSGTTKRRKTRRSINFKTARERRRANSAHRSEKPLDSLVEKAGNSKARVQNVFDNDREKSDGSIPTLKASTKELFDSSNSLSASMDTVSEVPPSRGKSPGNKHQKSRFSKPSDEKSNKDVLSDSLKKGKTSKRENDKINMENNGKSEKKIHRKGRKSINFTTARERKSANSRNRQEMSLDNLSKMATSSKGKKVTGLIKRSNPVMTRKTPVRAQEKTKKDASSTISAVSQVQTCQSDGETFQRKRFHESVNSSVQKSGSGLALRNAKRAKTSRDPNDELSSLNTSTTRKTGARIKRRPRRTQTIPDRIRDLKVTKKAFNKWKPVSNSTKEYAEQILKSVVLNVIADTSTHKNQEAVKCLAMLQQRVLERLPDLKAPYIQGDHRKMESQNKESEELLLEKSRELNMLDKKLEEEQRLLEVESAMVEEYTKKLELCKKELSSLDNEKAHPLIRETESVLNLSELPEESFGDQEGPLENSSEETQLSKTLVRLREKATSVGLAKWMNRLEKVTEDLLDKN